MRNQSDGGDTGGSVTLHTQIRDEKQSVQGGNNVGSDEDPEVRRFTHVCKTGAVAHGKRRSGEGGEREKEKEKA